MFKVELFCIEFFFFHLKDISTLHRKTGHENMKCPEKTGCLVTSPFFFNCTLLEATSWWESQTKPATGV